MDETDAPDWDVIKPALQSLFVNFNLDLDSVGTSRRLDFVLFEAIFYHIFIILDPQECRRKFWSSFPSRNPAERKQFVDRAAQLINEKKWYPARVTTSLLTMCGGAPFRRLLSRLIRKACVKEVEQFTGKLNPDVSDVTSEGVDFEQEYDKLQQELMTKENGEFAMLDLLDNLEEQRSNIAAETSRKWNNIATNFLDLKTVPRFDCSQFKLVYEKFVACLEKSHTEIKTMTEQVTPMQTNEGNSLLTNGTNHDDLRDPKVRESKRISDVIREMQKKLNVDINPLEEVDNKSSTWIHEQLNLYDQHVESLYLECEKAVERSEEATLKLPEISARFDLFKQIVPSIDIKPIFVSNSHQPDMTRLERTLPRYLNPSRYDIEEIIDCTKDYCKNLRS